MTKQEKYILKDLQTYKVHLYDMADNRDEKDFKQIDSWIEKTIAEIDGMLEECNDSLTMKRIKLECGNGQIKERLIEMKRIAEALRERAKSLQKDYNEPNEEQEYKEQ